MTTLLVAEWGVASYAANGDFQPGWDTEIRDDGGWFNPSTGEIALPDGWYDVTFSGYATQNIANVANQVYAYLALNGTSVTVQRHRERRAAGHLQPAFNLSGRVRSHPNAPLTALDLETHFRYDNTSDVEWAFRVEVQLI